MKKGYALIYTLLFIVLLMTTVATTWATGMADIKMQRRNEYSTAAYQLAKAALDDGFIKYENEIEKGTNNLIPAVTIPSPNCGVNVALVVRVNPNESPPTEIETKLSPAPTLSETVEGRYDYRICSTSNGEATTIEGIGYYRGIKITLKAPVDHTGDEPIMGPDPAYPTGPQIQVGIDHTADYLMIRQTGPSKK